MVSKPNIWTTFKAIIAAALVLQADAAANARQLAACDATTIVAVQTIQHLSVAEYRCAVSVQNICNYQMAKPLHYAAAVTEKLTVNAYGTRLVACWQHQLSNLRIRMNRNDHLSDLDKLVIEGDKLQVWWGRDGRKIRYLYSKGIIDCFIIDFIRDRVNGAKRQLAFSETPFLLPRLNNGNFPFGKTLNDSGILTEIQWFNAHTLMVSGTGGGKSNRSQYHAILIAPKVKGCWLIDIRKAEYRKLRPIFKQIGIDLKVIRGRNIQINPLQVPSGVQPIDYASVISDTLVRVLNLPPRSSILFRTTIIHLYAKYNILNGGQDYPHFFHLYDAIKENRDANPQARQAALDNLEVLLISLGPQMLGYHKGWDIQELARQHIVFELACLPDVGKDLILTTLLTSEFKSRIARGISNPKMDLWISFDEGQRIFSKKYESSNFDNPLIDLMGLVRGTGIGLDVSVLSTIDLSPLLPSLTSTKIIGRCGSITEYAAAGRFIGMNDEQIEWAAHHLVPGMFIGQVGEGNWRYPFVFKVPFIQDINSSTVKEDETVKTTRKFVTSKII